MRRRGGAIGANVPNVRTDGGGFGFRGLAVVNVERCGVFEHDQRRVGQRIILWERNVVGEKRPAALGMAAGRGNP